VNIAPVIIQPPGEIQSLARKSQKISEKLKKLFRSNIPKCRLEEMRRA